MPGEKKIPTYMVNVRKVEIPDLSRGECMTPGGRRVMDVVRDRKQERYIEAVRVAKALCARCPVRDECGTWVTRSESPAGSWDGIYAGMTSKRRRDLSLKRAVRKAG